MSPAICLEPELPAVETARRVLQAQLEYMELAATSIHSAEPVLAAEGVHDLRVAIRRSFSALNCFSPWLNKKWARDYAKDFKELLKPLGRTRDIDIIRDNILKIIPAGEVEESSIAKIISSRQQRQHEKITKRLGEPFRIMLNRKLTSLRTADATIRMSGVNHGSDRPVNLYRLQDCLPQILFEAGSALTAWHNTCPVVSDLKDDIADCDEEIIHNIRISARHFRYSLEFFAGLPRFNATDTVNEVKNLQNILGSWHDSLITCRYLCKIKKRYPQDGLIDECIAAAEKQKQEYVSHFWQTWPQYEQKWVYHSLRQSLNRLYRSETKSSS